VHLHQVSLSACIYVMLKVRCIYIYTQSLTLTHSLTHSRTLAHIHTHTQLAMIVEPLIDHNMLYSGWKPLNAFQTWTSHADSVGMKPFEPQVCMRLHVCHLSLRYVVRMELCANDSINV